jgi:hypothetical protein
MALRIPVSSVAHVQSTIAPLVLGLLGQNAEQA